MDLGANGVTIHLVRQHVVQEPSVGPVNATPRRQRTTAKVAPESLVKQRAVIVYANVQVKELNFKWSDSFILVMGPSGQMAANAGFEFSDRGSNPPSMCQITDVELRQVIFCSIVP